MENENQKHALVTGATSGIGYELAKLLAADGYDLVLIARNKEMLDRVKAELLETNTAIHIHVAEFDLFEPSAPQKIYNYTAEKGIRIDVLVNNAGQGEWGRFAETDLSRELDIIQLNIVAMVTLTKLFLKDMVARNEGKILQLASSISKVPSPYMSVYAATKAFVLSFAEALAREIEDTDVTITALQPGATDTDFFHKAKAEHSVTYKESSMYDPAIVARAGYEGLKSGDLTVMPGAMNKLQGAMNTLLPDSAVTASMEMQMKPSTKSDGRTQTGHAPSLRERQAINRRKGSYHGDM